MSPRVENNRSFSGEARESHSAITGPQKQQREDPLKAARIKHLSAGLAVYNLSKTKLQGTSRIDLSDEVMRDAIANEAFGRCAGFY